MFINEIKDGRDEKQDWRDGFGHEQSEVNWVSGESEGFGF